MWFDYYKWQESINFIGRCENCGSYFQPKRSQRIKLQEEQILLLGAKVYYKQAGMWIAAENTGETLEEAYNMMEKTTEIFARSVDDVKDSLNNIGEMVPAIEEKNPGLIDDITDILEWG